jgi:hypothetical protein
VLKANQEVLRINQLVLKVNLTVPRQRVVQRVLYQLRHNKRHKEEKVHHQRVFDID